LVRLVQRLQDREAGAAADVRAQPDIDLVPFGHRQVEQAAAEEEVGRGTEGDGRAGFRQALAFLITQMHPVREHRALAQ
nr:hypothetical protein [Tanacetum cinerariifolium]